MTRTPFDHFAKALLLAHEGARGRAETEFELPGESVFVDLAWTPTRRPPRHTRTTATSRPPGAFTRSTRTRSVISPAPLR